MTETERQLFYQWAKGRLKEWRIRYAEKCRKILEESDETQTKA